MDLHAVFSSLLFMLNKKTYILLRIEFLVVTVTVLFLVMSIMDIFRRHFHSPLIKSIFNLLDAVSDSIVIYILGSMKTAPIQNQLFPVWAIVLVNFRNSIDFITGYGVPDSGGRRFTEYRNVMKLLAVAFLYQTSKSEFVFPLWSLWGMQILRSFYRFQTRDLAARSIWLGRSSSLISEYMRIDRVNADSELPRMGGYKYLVYGEKEKNVEFKGPHYVFDLVRQQQATSRDALTTLDKIWNCDGHLLSENRQAGDLKDLSLAFALSRLLRCRLEDVVLHADAHKINQELIKAKIIDDESDANRVFGIMDIQLAFLNDYFNTRCPMVFWCGLPSLFFSLIQSVVTFAVVCWLSVDIRKVYNPPEGDTAHVVHGFNVDIITWVFMFFMMFKEVWEMVTYLLSDWTRLLLTCMYVRLKCKCMRSSFIEGTISSFFTSKLIADRWHGVIDQYAFLQSYDGIPTIWNLIHKLTVGMVPEKAEGAELGDAINIPECVKTAILESLRSLFKDLENNYLPKEIQLPNEVDRDRLSPYRWTFELPTCSHIILVWHIATSICEMELAEAEGVNLGKPGFLRGLFSCLFCSSKPYLVEKKLPGELQESYEIANSLSRYCGYLLVSKPELIPDSFLVPKMIFQDTVKHARDHTLKECDSLQCTYDKLKPEAVEAAKETADDVLQQGALLAMDLLHHESKEQRWKVLAGVWAQLIVHLAPSWNATAHKKCLESGGEFITHIWALLWLCGVEKSELWPVEDVPENNAPPGAHQYSTVHSMNDQTEQEMQLAAARPGEREEVDTSRSRSSGSVNRHSNLVRGMKNLGNTCYFNAVLQSLLALDNMRAMLELNALEGSLGQELKSWMQLTQVMQNILWCQRNSSKL